MRLDTLSSEAPGNEAGDDWRQWTQGSVVSDLALSLGCRTMVRDETPPPPVFGRVVRRGRARITGLNEGRPERRLCPGRSQIPEQWDNRLNKGLCRVN